MSEGDGVYKKSKYLKRIFRLVVLGWDELV